MPGSPPATPNFQLPRFADADAVSFSSQVNSVSDRLDAYLINLIFQPGDLIITPAAARLGALPCDGNATYSASTYPALASVIGSGSGGTYGAAPTGKLKLPDFRGLVIVGAGQGTGLAIRRPGDRGGEEMHMLSIAELPPHAHPSLSGAYFLTGRAAANAEAGAGLPAVENRENATALIGGGGAHNNMQPFGVAWVHIKT